ncbi:MAG: hypothetical protein ABIK07_05355 [Planctomycetota bacterium]|jgi:hypothetical protein
MKLLLENFVLMCMLVCGLHSEGWAETQAVPTQKKIEYSNAQCEGTYPHHLQGICIDGQGNIFWSFTTELVKTNAAGKILLKIPVGNHHGDLCFQGGKVFVAVNFGQFNNAEGKSDSWVYVYDAEKLLLIAKHQTSEVIFGAGGIAYHQGKFIVVGGLPKDVNENYLYEYDENFKFLKKHVLKSGYTLMGIQTATFADNQWWFGCYGTKLLKADVDLNFIAKYDIECSLGVERVTDKLLLIGRGAKVENQHTGSVLLAVPDEKLGFVIQK